MKVKFIRPFRFIGNNPDDGSDSTVSVEHIVDLENDESAQWLINNGFAEKVKEKWPRYGDRYWYVLFDGFATRNDIDNIFLLNNLKTIGNVFKTEKSAKRFIDYLKAVETVRHDEGFMKYDKTYGKGWILRRPYLVDSEGFFAVRCVAVGFHYPGAFYFDTEEHAKASSRKHHNEWQTILDYDWSKGEDEEEDED